MATRSPTAAAQAVAAYAEQPECATLPRERTAAHWLRFATAARTALWRTGRSVVWRFPRAYCRGAPRDGESSCASDFWIGGLPHSGQTALHDVLRRAFGKECVVSHLHVPPLIIHALRTGRPGAVMVSAPREAILSCAAATGRPVRDCLDDYIDFHRVLWSYRARLLFVAHDEVQRDPVEVVQRLERWFALAPTFFDPQQHRESSDQPLPRPAACEALMRRLGHDIDRSPALRAKLREAGRLYRDYTEVVRAEVEG